MNNYDILEKNYIAFLRLFLEGKVKPSINNIHYTKLRHILYGTINVTSVQIKNSTFLNFTGQFDE